MVKGGCVQGGAGTVANGARREIGMGHMEHDKDMI
jgi:hypothetical protein